MNGAHHACAVASHSQHYVCWALLLPVMLLLLNWSACLPACLCTHRSRFWLFLSYVVSFASVVGAVWVLMQHYGEPGALGVGMVAQRVHNNGGARQASLPAAVRSSVCMHLLLFRLV